MKSRSISAVSQPIAVLAVLVLVAWAPLAMSADEKPKSSSSGSCSTEMVTSMKSALTECMPQKGAAGGGADKGGSKGGKSGNLLDAENPQGIEPRLASLQSGSQSGGSSGQSSSKGDGQDAAAPPAKGGSKGGNDTSPLACTLTKLKGKSKNLDDVMTQCQSAGANASNSDSNKGGKSASSGSSQAQKDKQHGGGAKEGGSSAAGGSANPMDTCILQKLADVCPEFQADPTVAAAFPSQSSSDDKKHSKN